MKIYLASMGLFRLCFGKKTQLCVRSESEAHGVTFHTTLIVSQLYFCRLPPRPITGVVLLCVFLWLWCIGSHLSVDACFISRVAEKDHGEKHPDKWWNILTMHVSFKKNGRERPWRKTDLTSVKKILTDVTNTTEKWIWGWQVWWCHIKVWEILNWGETERRKADAIT